MKNSARFLGFTYGKVIKGLFVFLLLSFFFPKNAFAVISACDATVDTANININTSANPFSFTITNNDNNNSQMVWIKISVPSANFTIDGSGNSITFTGFGIGAGSPIVENLSATVGNIAASSANWTVQVSNDSAGANPTTCTGSLGTSIIDPATLIAPVISNATLSSLTSSSVTISWTTDKNANSQVDYGETNSYGSTKSDSTMQTAHSITINSLSSLTVYHFNIKSADVNGNNVYSGDNSFKTAEAGSTGTTQTITVTKNVTPTPTPTPLPDTTIPFVTVSTDFSKPFVVAPQITGKATDNNAVARLEYSLDGGQNYLPVDSMSTPNKKSTNFDFIPQVSDDGNYSLKIRAYDSSDNIGYTKNYTLVIDRLSPQVSGVLFSLGPQVISPRQDGSILTIGGQPLKITLSEVGGSIKIEILAFNLTNKSSKTYSLTKNPDSGLWSGKLPLEEKGEYQLKFNAVDGAGNKTETDLNKVVVVESGRIIGVDGNIPNAKITVFYQEPQSKAWQIWDGRAYSQTNPQKTDKNGNYSLFLPGGRYYLQIESYGYQTLETEFFTIDNPQPINANFTLKPLKLIFSLGFIKLYFPDFSTFIAPFKNNIPNVSSNTNKLLGKEAPFFSLNLLNQSRFDSNSLRGRPAVLSFLNTWSPSSLEQVSILDKFSKNNNFNSATIIVGEKNSKVYIFQKRGGYSLKMIADSDATLVIPYGLSALPVHYFIDRRGVIKDIVAGVLSENELESKLLDISN